MGTKLSSLLKKLKSDMKRHQDVGPRLTQEQIDLLEKRLGLRIPQSYRSLLLEFGDGAYWLYGQQPIDTISQRQGHWLRSIRAEAPGSIAVDGGGQVPIESLVLLMSEDSNGGSWCWLTSQAQPDGEWPLAYYHQSDKALHYRVPNLVEWLDILVKRKTEVIRALDKELKLGLG